jgi:hypothetical protein
MLAHVRKRETREYELLGETISNEQVDKLGTAKLVREVPDTFWRAENGEILLQITPQRLYSHS